LQTVIESLKKWVRRIEDDLAAAAGETGALAPRQPGEDYDAWQARRRLYLENYTPAKRAA
jgi:hypothetical protein